MSQCECGQEIFDEECVHLSDALQSMVAERDAANAAYEAMQTQRDEARAALNQAALERLDQISMPTYKLALAAARTQTLKEAEGIARAELSDWRGSTGGIERIADAIAALATPLKTGDALFWPGQ